MQWWCLGGRWRWVVMVVSRQGKRRGYSTMTGDGSGTRAGGQALLFGMPAQSVCSGVCATPVCSDRPESSPSSRTRRVDAFSTTVTA
ncbi:uncharacterized protein BKA78DRAFT_320295, partial [Phyllosticta capitalensis]|uniref:uncharacterized protein n=1 Tax=Phyllosticta capitalensis TaxID=121624 RepID=UPI0031327F28